MHCTTAEFPNDWKDARIYILSDLHIGDPHCSDESVAARISRIKDDPHGLCVLNGDILNTALRNSVSDVYGEVLSPMKQIERAVQLLSPVKDRIIAADTGNHEQRVYKSDGIDIMRLVCRELGIERHYAPEGVLCFLTFGKKIKHSGGKYDQGMTYSIYATHGTGGGRKEGAKALRLADMASIVDADIYIHSHTHLPIVMKQGFHRIDVQNHSARVVEKLFVNDGASLTYGGYGQAYEFKPSSTASPVIHLNGCRREFKSTV